MHRPTPVRLSRILSPIASVVRQRHEHSQRVLARCSAASRGRERAIKISRLKLWRLRAGQRRAVIHGGHQDHRHPSPLLRRIEDFDQFQAAETGHIDVCDDQVG